MCNADSFESYKGPTHPHFEKFLNVLQTTLAYNLLQIVAPNTWPGYDVQYIISGP